MGVCIRVRVSVNPNYTIALILPVLCQYVNLCSLHQQSPLSLIFFLLDLLDLHLCGGTAGCDVFVFTLVHCQ